MTEEQIKQKAEDYIITRQNHIKYYSGEAVKILLKNFSEEIVAEATKELEQQIEKMKRHCNCKHRDSEGYCEVKRTYLMDLSYDGCDKWELEETRR